MATAFKRQTRRRIAAINFLSSISLDGNRDIKFGLVFNVIQSKRSQIDSDSEEQDILVNPNISETSVTLENIGVITNGYKSDKRKNGSIKHEKINNFGSEESIGNSINGGTIRTASSISSSISDTIKVRDKHQKIKFLKTPKDHQIKDERIVFVSGTKAPIAIFSALPHTRRGLHNSLRNDVRQDLNKRRHASGSRQLSTISDGPDPLDLLIIMGFDRSIDGQDISFSKLLNCQKVSENNGVITLNEAIAYYHKLVSLCFSTEQTMKSIHCMPNQVPVPQSVCDFDDENISEDKKQISYQYFAHHCNIYHPNMLDDPELIAGKHSTLLAFPSFMTSIINYVKPYDLKKELNDKFKERFPYIQLTLSKMRSLKKEMCKIARQECNVDFLTIAQAYVYFEKLILKSLLNKQNRKLCAGACLLLSAKLNDIKGAELKNLIEKIESGFRLNRNEFLSMEFGVLVALEFSLHLPNWEITPHFQRLLYES